MKVLTAAEMREVDRRTAEAGIPNLILMENAGHRVVEVMERELAPLAAHRIAVFCGKGNNGGDGLVIARQLFTRVRPRSLHVVLAAPAAKLQGDAAANLRMLEALGCPVSEEVTPEIRRATVVVDALLGTGLQGPAQGRTKELIREINQNFPGARVVAVDVPSGMQSDTADTEGDVAAAHFTVTFTAPKPCHVLPPNCDRTGKLFVKPIGSPEHLFEHNQGITLHLSEARLFESLFGDRSLDSNKGNFGHVLVVAGASGKTGAAAMAGIAALRIGAGLATVASAASAISTIASHAPELMTVPLPETGAGSIASQFFEAQAFERLLERKTVCAIGPGLGSEPDTVEFIRRAVAEISVPLVIDADGLNALAGRPLRGGAARILTPHPGEMARLAQTSIAQVQSSRVETARAFAWEHGVYVVLKGHRSVIAFPDKRVYINPADSPALATGGTGDVLTGMISGLIAQFPEQLETALLAAVYLHGRSGQIGAQRRGERGMLATDLFEYLPEAIRECANLLHRV